MRKLTAKQIENLTTAGTYEDEDGLRLLVKPNGKKYRMLHFYVLRLTKDEIPSERAFWLLTMHDDHQLLTENSIGRYAIGDRNKLQFGTDGPLEISSMNPQGKDKEANRLPTPAKGEFSMPPRLYWPEARVLDGRWAPQPVKRID